MNDLKDTLCRLVAIQSDNPPEDPSAKGEEKAALFIESFFRERGIPTERVAVDERFCVIARRKGKNSAKTLTFTGHFDVVPVSRAEKERWLTPPFEAVEKDGKIYARGSADMKSGLAAIMHAMCDAEDPACDVVLLATCDEEFMMKGSQSLRNYLKAEAGSPLVVAEPTDMRLAYASRGRTFGKCIFKGRTAHGSQPGCGVNTVSCANRLLNAMEKQDFSDTNDGLSGMTFWQPLAMEARLDPGIIPDLCLLEIDARLSLKDSSDDLWRKMEALCKACESRYDGKLSIETVVADRREPWITREDHPLLQSIDRACLSLGRKCPERMIFMGSTDANRLNTLGYACAIIGPGSLALAHKENEYVDLSEFYAAYRLYSALIKEGIDE